MKAAIERRMRLKTPLLPALAALLLIVHQFAPYRGWWILLLGLGGLWLVAYVWTRSLMHHLDFQREIRSVWTQVGDQMAERFTLSNDSWVPAPWVEVTDHSTLPDYRPNCVVSLRWRDETSWEERSVCSRRGAFMLGPTTLTTGDPFGIYQAELKHNAKLPITVLPPVVPLPPLWIRANGDTGESSDRQRALEYAVSAAGVREYQPGDSLRRIHWRTSARRDELFVRLFDGPTTHSWWIVLDLDRRAHVGSGNDSTEEHAVILAASLAEQGFRTRQSVGLAAQGERLIWVPPQNGHHHRWEILDGLARAKPGSHTLADFLNRLAFRVGNDAGLIVITPAVTGNWLEAFTPLLRREVTSKIFLLDPASFGSDGNLRQMETMLSEMRLDYHIIPHAFLEEREPQPIEHGWVTVDTERPSHATWQELD